MARFDLNGVLYLMAVPRRFSRFWLLAGPNRRPSPKGHLGPFAAGSRNVTRSFGILGKDDRSRTAMKSALIKIGVALLSLVSLFVVAIIGVRIYQAVQGPPLEPWHT